MDHIVLFLFIALVAPIQYSLGLNDANDLILTSDEKNALQEFKSQVSDLLPEDFMKTDFYLIRWLRVANLDLPKAQKLLQHSVSCRQQNNISQVLSEDWSDMRQDYPLSFEGHDREGRPILTLDFAAWDLRRAALQGRMPRLQRYLQYALEQTMHNVFEAQQNQAKEGKPVTVSRAITISDLDGFNVFQHGCLQCVAAMGSWIIMYDSHYPLFYDEVISVDAPQAAVIVINALRPLMSEATSNMLKIFNSNKEAWMKYLDERVDRNERGVKFGGTRDIFKH